MSLQGGDSATLKIYLRTVTISDLETTIYDNEFYGCSNLQSFSCGDGVTSIGKWAFSGCSSLKSYSSGTNVASIGEEAFSDCTGLTSFTTLAPVPPTCGKQALDDINKWECTLHVPSESIDEYKTAEQWKEFFFIDDVIAGVDSVIAGDVSIALRITSDGLVFEGDAALRISVYSPDGKQIISSLVQPFQKVNLSSGLYIVKVGEKGIKVRI